MLHRDSEIVYKQAIPVSSIMYFFHIILDVQNLSHTNSQILGTQNKKLLSNEKLSFLIYLSVLYSEIKTSTFLARQKWKNQHTSDSSKFTPLR